MEESKQEYCLNLKDIQECLHQKEVLENATKKTAARKEAKKVLEERFKTGKSRWFFTRLAF